MSVHTGTGKYGKLLLRCEGLAPVAAAVEHPCEEGAPRGAIEAGERRLITPILVGPTAKIGQIAKQRSCAIAMLAAHARRQKPVKA